MRILKFTANIILAVAALSAAQRAARQANVKYLSGENVYVDAGTADSLRVGDRLKIIRNDTLVAVLEIAFAAEHSASCQILTSVGAIEIGDKATLEDRAATAEIKTPAETQTDTSLSTAAPAQPQPRKKSPAAKISGGFSVQLHQWDDRTASNLDFIQPGARLNFKANKIWGRDLAINIRITTRYNKRTREYNSDVPRTEWRNRIYQLSIGYGSDQSPLSFQLGRIITNKISGVGYIDGLVMQKSVAGGLSVGAFGGTQPHWQYSNFQTSLQKYGGYLHFAGGDMRTDRLESTLAAAGEYHGGTVSREFLFLRNNVALARRWNIYQSAELDINRSWRKVKTGENLNLTNLYISGRGKFTNWLSLGLSFDNRRNYWTFETMTLTDSLFDDVLRRGFRGDISLRPHKEYMIFSNLGYHKRSSDRSATYSYSLGLNRTNFLLESLSLNLQFAGFRGPFTDGYNYSARFSRYFRRGDMLSVGYGAYIYAFGTSGADRKNDWVNFSGQFDLFARLYSTATYEYNMGDDSRGHRLLAELGYRF